MRFFKIVFLIVSVLSLNVCKNEATPSRSLEPNTERQKSCKDLNENDCLLSENLIGKKCRWGGKVCEEKIGQGPDLNKCQGLNQNECMAAIMAHGRCIWRNNTCEDKPSLAKELVTYLEAPSLGHTVSELAKIGIENYKKSPLLRARQQARNNNTTGGGRSAHWIEDTFGKSEAQIIGELKTANPLRTWDLTSIDEAFLDITKNNPRATTNIPTFYLVKGLSVNYLHDYPEGKDAIIQLASQFNFLESVSSSKASVSSYLNDSTQGPQGSIEAAASALLRTALEGEGKLLHALHSVFSGDVSSYYKNGYFEPSKLNNNEQQNLLTHIKTTLPKMTILPQWVMCEASGAFQLQIFSAAPSYQGAPSPVPGSAGAELCDELVSAQYEAIAKMAVIRSLKIGKQVPVHFTLVGQGAFNNPSFVMATSFKKVAQIVKGYKITVYIHGYGANDQAAIRSLADPAFFDLKELTKEEFQAK